MIFFATLDADTKAVKRVFFTRIFVKVEFLLLCKNDIVVKSLLRQFVGRYPPKFAGQAKGIIIGQEKVFIVHPDMVFEARVHFQN